MVNQPESILVELIRYNNWATQQVLAVCKGLSEEQLATSGPGAYGTIFDTLLHMIIAEADYISRMTGVFPQPHFQRGDDVSIEDLAIYAEKVGAAFLDTIQRIAPDEIVHEEEDDLFIDYQARLLFMQAVIHGVEHRTNVTTILNSMGIALPEMDGWGYLQAHADRLKLKEGKLSE